MTQAPEMKKAVEAATTAILNAKRPDGKRVHWSPMYIPPYTAAEIFARAAIEAARPHLLSLSGREIVRAIEVVDDVCVLNTPPADDPYERAMHEVGTEIVRRLRALPATPAGTEWEDGQHELLGFLAIHADQYQRDHGLDGLHPTHYDLMKKYGAPMQRFKRATNAPMITDHPRALPPRHEDL